jgi:O-methyltransferase
MDQINSYQDLSQHLIDGTITMCWKELFELPLRHYKTLSSIEGDIVECGVWRGGMAIYLSHVFSDKNIWCYDSYEGFQPLKETTYKYTGVERHTPAFKYGAKGPLGISLEEVKNNFELYGLGNQERIKFVEGFVNKTLPYNTIDKISILRIDVDSYSATLEVLDHLYDKVQTGGFVIFDDANLTESADAIKDFLKQRNLPIELHNPYDDNIYPLKDPVIDTDSGYHSNSYLIK